MAVGCSSFAEGDASEPLCGHGRQGRSTSTTCSGVSRTLGVAGCWSVSFMCVRSFHQTPEQLSQWRFSLMEWASTPSWAFITTLLWCTVFPYQRSVCAFLFGLFFCICQGDIFMNVFACQALAVTSPTPLDDWNLDTEVLSLEHQC